MPKAKKASKKKVGRTIADSDRRFLYDAGGRKPLTQYPLVPITVTFPEQAKLDIAALSETFIDPVRLKPYGVAAVCRVMIAEQEKEIDRAPREELIAYAADNAGSPGRNNLSEKISRLALLIPKHLIERINDRVLALNEPLVGTATVVRWLIIRGLKLVSPSALYTHIPTADMAYIIRNKWTIADILKAYNAKT